MKFLLSLKLFISVSYACIEVTKIFSMEHKSEPKHHKHFKSVLLDEF